METTHTPGPWELENRHTVHIPGVAFLNVPKAADAALIAAAPELLEALKAQEAAFIAEENYRFNEIGAHPNTPVSEETRGKWLRDLEVIAGQQLEARRMIRAAIAKAEGRI